ncbi:Uncharacterised protein [Mycobacteroides abscessus subsp. massiliense]|nr:Uncharacterised protein [Mycobacteroides abscessus subsp. massiliense]
MIAQADHAEYDRKNTGDDADEPRPAPQVRREGEHDLHEATEQQVDTKEDTQDQ